MGYKSRVMEIRLLNVSKSFGAARVIDNVSLEIRSGSFTTLLGSSGSGKTTLLRMIAGLETPGEGEIWLDDRCVFSSDGKINVPPEKRGLGFVFQDFALWPHMTVFENVAFGLRVRGEKKNIKERVMSALSSVKLEDYAARYPQSLSGGQQQRVAFARALVIGSGCILFDEPLSALDALLREQMREELRSLVSEYKITAVFVTHDQSEAMSMSDNIAILHNGRIEQYDTPQNIYSHPSTLFTASFIGTSDWIDDRCMVRPEKLTTEPSDTSFRTTVLNSAFLGSRYRVNLSHNGREWVFYSDKSLTPGEELTLYADEKNIIRI